MADSYAVHDRALLPLRGFLGITFLYAGLQKFADPGFLDPQGDSSIQAQLGAVRRRSPVGPLLGPATHHAVLLGVTIALVEVAVGVATLLGLWTRVAAVGGTLLSLGFFLTVSFHARPYYYGPDIVFLFAWLPLALAGPGAWSLDARLARPRGTVAGDAALVGRRRVTAALGGAVVVAAASAAGLGRLLRNGRAATSTEAAPVPSPPLGSPTHRSRPARVPHPSGRAIGPASAVPVGGAARFDDPYTGEPAYVVQPRAGEYLAFSRICTHAGCRISFAGPTFDCPCHGAQFDATTGAVVAGPADQPLRRIRVTDVGGQLYASNR